MKNTSVEECFFFEQVIVFLYFFVHMFYFVFNVCKLYSFHLSIYVDVFLFVFQCVFKCSSCVTMHGVDIQVQPPRQERTQVVQRVPGLGQITWLIMIEKN